MARPKKTMPQAETIQDTDALFDAPDASEDSILEAPAPQAAPAQVQVTKRVYKGTQELDHDLFKLSPAKMRKNVSYIADDPIFELFDHSHIYHTIDSNGRKLDTSAPVGGHFHFVKVTANGSDVPSVEVSQAMQWSMKKIGKNKFEKVAVPVDHDSHTHNVEYLGSEKIQMRKPNVEAAKAQAALEAKFNQKMDGVVG